MSTTGLLDALRRVVGDPHVLTGDATAGFATDWTGRWQGHATAVVRPGSTAEVSAVVLACGAAGVPIVPQGGNTGLVGGGVPRGGEVVLSTSRLVDIVVHDGAPPSAHVGAGTVLEVLRTAVAPLGLDVGVDMASRGAASIGGMVATNAGGIHVVAHGTMRSQVLGLEAVLADGSVIRRMSGLVKDGAGYDLTQLLVGSEGTLAVITAVALRLVRRPDVRLLALLRCTSADDAVALLPALRAAGSLHAVELMDAEGLATVASHTGMRPPLDIAPPAVALLVEWAGHAGTAVPDDAVLASVVGDRAAVIAQDAADADRLWTLREQHTASIAAVRPSHKLDVTVPPAAIGGFLDRLRAVHPDTIAFGHLAEGTLHLNLQVRDDDRVLGWVAEAGGSVAAEHGIGAAKVAHIGRTRSAAELAAMQRVKDALDPAGLLNPGVVLPPRRLTPDPRPSVAG